MYGESFGNLNYTKPFRQVKLQTLSRQNFSRRRRKFPHLFILLLFLFLLFILFDFLKQKNNDKLISPVLNKSSQLEKTTQEPRNNLSDAVMKSLNDIKGDYGIVIKNLKNGETYKFNEHKVYEVGSLYKLWVMGTIFNKIQSGSLNEDEILTEDIVVLNDKFNIDPDLAELSDGSITLNVKDALNQMITISHNYAALLLTEKVKLSQVSEFLKKNNFNESKVGVNGESPLSTPSDIALFFEKLYKGELGSSENTEKMLNLLKKQTLNNKLPKGLPQGVSIAHKTGEIDYFSHDAGIVFLSSGDYIIVVLSKTDYPPGAEERISMVSKAVYEYFNTTQP